jgi:hypothetical protein
MSTLIIRLNTSDVIRIPRHHGEFAESQTHRFLATF